MTAARALLRQPTFTPLLASRFIASASIGFGQLALAWGTMGLGYGPEKLVLVLACNTCPALLIVFGGVVGDRYRRHHALLAADALACLAWLALGTVFFLGGASIILLCALAAWGGIATAISLPTLRGIVVDLVPESDWRVGNALLNQAQSIGLFVGLVSSGMTVAALGPAWAATTRGVLCGISAYLLSHLATSRPKAADSELLNELREGWYEFKTRPWLWVMTLQSTAVTAAVVCYTKIAGPVYTAHGHGGAWAWGVISACDPLGALVGSLIGARWRPSRTLLTAAALPALVAAPMLLMGDSASWRVIAVAAFVPGVFQAVYYVLWTTVLQKNMASEVLVRVNSWNIVTGYCLVPLAVLLSGPLAQRLSPQALATGAGLVAVGATAVAVASLCALSRVRLSLHSAREDRLLGDHILGS